MFRERESVREGEPVDRRVPFELYLFVTPNCPLKCEGCSTRVGEDGELTNPRVTMEVEDVQWSVGKAIEAARLTGCSTLHLKWGGGEPTQAMQVLLESQGVVREAVGEVGVELEQVLLTNGVNWLRRRDELEQLLRGGRWYVSWSQWGLPEKNVAVRGGGRVKMPETLEVVEMLEGLREQNHEFGYHVEHTLMPENAPDLAEFLRYWLDPKGGGAAENVGKSLPLKINIWRPEGRALTAEEVMQIREGLDKAWPVLYRLTALGWIDPSQLFGYVDVTRERERTCQVGRTTFAAAKLQDGRMGLSGCHQDLAGGRGGLKWSRLNQLRRLPRLY